MKKVAIIGKGTAGALSAMVAYEHSLKTNQKILIEWYFDSEKPTQAVGEGTTLVVPIAMAEGINFQHYQLNELDGTFKCGISKKNWSKSDYVHPFQPPLVAYHFNALKLQDYILNVLKQQANVTIIDRNVSSSQIDADLIIDCSGKPDSYEDFILSPYMAVNSVHVTQCYWDNPRFFYTISDATKYGWVFGVPLQNRCSIGYLYNNKFNSLDEIKEDVKNIFQMYDLEPSDKTNSFSFENYYRKKNFSGNVAYNGNASFFLEPLEATSTSVIIKNAKNAILLMEQNFAPSAIHEFNFDYIQMMESISTMIMTHYFAGSVFKTDFWTNAEQKAIECLRSHYKSHTEFRLILKYYFHCMNDERVKNPFFDINLLAKHDKKFKSMIDKMPKEGNYGTWASTGWAFNLTGLNLYDKIKSHLNLDDLGNKIN